MKAAILILLLLLSASQIAQATRVFALPPVASGEQKVRQELEKGVWRLPAANRWFGSTRFTRQEGGDQAGVGYALIQFVTEIYSSPKKRSKTHRLALFGKKAARYLGIPPVKRTFTQKTLAIQPFEPTDGALVDLMQGGDKAASEAIYRRYWQKLCGCAFRQLNSRKKAEEIVHDLMPSLWQNRGRASIQNLEVYIFIAPRNPIHKSINSQIDLRKYREHQLLTLVDETFQTQAILDANDLAAAIEIVLGQMPEKTATIFRLSKMEQLPVKTIASRLNLSEKAVENHITKSLKLMRKHLGDFHSDN